MLKILKTRLFPFFSSLVVVLPLMTLRDLCGRWFGVGAPDRSTSAYRNEFEAIFHAFHRHCDGVMRSVFPSTLLKTLLTYCRAGQFTDAPDFIHRKQIQEDDDLPLNQLPQGWDYVTPDVLSKLTKQGRVAESDVMRGEWVSMKGFPGDATFLMLKFRDLRFYPVFDVSDQMVRNMLTPPEDGGDKLCVLYYIPPFQCSMSALTENVSDSGSVGEILLDIKSPLRVGSHYQFFMFLYQGKPVWLVAPQSARISPETVSVTRLLFMLEHMDFF
jgi:hypothetical protein